MAALCVFLLCARMVGAFGKPGEAWMDAPGPSFVPNDMRVVQTELPLGVADPLRMVTPLGAHPPTMSRGSPGAAWNPVDVKDKMTVRLVHRALANSTVGKEQFPFTTRNAHAVGSSSPTSMYPWRATGRLSFIKNGSTSTTVCTGSLIGPGLVLTAAHCVCVYGKKAFHTNFQFIPALYDTTKPYGTWGFRRVVAPASYFDGTDRCQYNATACENDLALLSLFPNASGVYPGPSTGWYAYASDGYSASAAFYPNASSLHITQLGYPVSFSGGLRMIRNDGVAVSIAGSMWSMGSAMTGGSSGGPWLVNFGADVDTTSPRGVDPQMAVVAVTSWGNSKQAMGASRFGKNTVYTTTSNIQSLVTAMCNVYTGGGPTTDRCRICNLGC